MKYKLIFDYKALLRFFVAAVNGHLFWVYLIFEFIMCAPASKPSEAISVAIQAYLPSVNENPMDCVRKGISPSQVDSARESRIYYLSELGPFQEPYSQEHERTLSEIKSIKSRALCSERFTMASCSGIILSGVLAAISCSSAYFAADALDGSVVFAMFFAGTANALGNLIMYRDSRNQSHAADLKQDLYRRLGEEYTILAKRLLEHHYLYLATAGAVDAKWVDVALKVQTKCVSILERFAQVFPEAVLDPAQIVAPLFDAAHHIVTGRALYRADLRDYIHSWRQSQVKDTPPPSPTLLPAGEDVRAMSAQVSIASSSSLNGVGVGILV